MRIQSVECYLAEYDSDPRKGAMGSLAHRNIPIVRIVTDEGLHGVGEAFTVGPDLATAKTIEYYAEWLIGRDPFDIEGLWQLMYNGSRFPGGSMINAAISGIEHALWDIKGKALGVPVYELIGGKCRDKVRVYQSAGGKTPQQVAEHAAALVAKYGYTGLKMGPWPQGDKLWHDMGLAEMAKGAAARLEAVREAVGDAVDIGLDAHAQAASPLQALELAHALAPYHPLFLEEPLRPENRVAFGYLRSKSPVPIATGESMYTRFEFRDLLAHQGADIIQPDITVVGGLWEMRKIAAMAEAEYVLVAPHNPCGPIANAVNLHFCMATPNLLILEYKPDDVFYRRDLVDEPIPLVDGFLVPPARPGLGIDLNLDYVKDYQYRSWHRPFLWRMDGSLGLQ